MRKVSELLASRPSKAQFAVACDMPAQEAIQQLVFHNLSTLIVMSENTPVGVISHKGLLLRVATGAADFDGLTARHVMSPDIAYATPETSLLECMVMMTGYVSGAMPVLDQGKLAGVVEMREVTREVLAEQRNEKKVKRSFHHLRRSPLKQRLEASAKH